MLESFMAAQPEALEQARLLVAEMARLATLWEEAWAAGLQDAQVRGGAAHRFCNPVIGSGEETLRGGQLRRLSWPSLGYFSQSCGLIKDDLTNGQIIEYQILSLCGQQRGISGNQDLPCLTHV